MPVTSIGDRNRLADRLMRILSSRFIVCIGGRVFAYRLKDEIVDDGEHAGQALYNGVFERMHGISMNGGKRTHFMRWSLYAPEIRYA